MDGKGKKGSSAFKIICAVAVVLLCIAGRFFLNRWSTEHFSGDLSSKGKAGLFSTISSKENDEALDKAKDVLSYSTYSRDGLIRYLERQDFSTKAAEYAADNCGADWKDEAVKAAKRLPDETLEYYGITKEGMVKCLEDAGFSPEQAAYGAKKCGRW